MTQFLLEAVVTLFLLGLATAAIWVISFILVWRLWLEYPAADAPREISESTLMSALITLLILVVLGVGWAAAVDMWSDPFTTRPGAAFVALATSVWAILSLREFRGWPFHQTPGRP